MVMTPFVTEFGAHFVGTCLLTRLMRAGLQSDASQGLNEPPSELQSRMKIVEVF